MGYEIRSSDSVRVHNRNKLCSKLTWVVQEDFLYETVLELKSKKWSRVRGERHSRWISLFYMYNNPVDGENMTIRIVTWPVHHKNTEQGVGEHENDEMEGRKQSILDFLDIVRYFVIRHTRYLFSKNRSKWLQFS